MFHVAACAISLSRGGLVGTGVKARARFDAALDLDVTIEAFESPRAISDIVALAAFRNSLERRMRA
jgi:hypothetical protein